MQFYLTLSKNQTIISLGKTLTKMFDPRDEFTLESGWIYPYVSGIPGGYSDNQLDFIYNLIRSKEVEPRYEPFTNRTPLICPNLESGIGSICNPCGEPCIGLFSTQKK